MTEPLVVFCDTLFPSEAHEKLVSGLSRHRLVLAANPICTNLQPSKPDPVMREATVIFGQPDPAALMGSSRLRWVHLTSAGYGRYDTAALHAEARSRGFALTTSSSVYADPCAEHVLALMLAAARQLPECFADQRARTWESGTRRQQSFLLRGQRVLLLGWGAIAQRLARLLEPFEVELGVFRRTPGPCCIAGRHFPAVAAMTTVAELDAGLTRADHVVDLLPDNDRTLRLIDAERLAHFKEGAIFYNVGRGITVDTPALMRALHDRRIGGALLDVTDPEPPAADDPLWTCPGLVLTPHCAGGRNTEHVALVEHFLENLRRLERGEPLVDRVL